MPILAICPADFKTGTRVKVQKLYGNPATGTVNPCPHQKNPHRGQTAWVDRYGTVLVWVEYDASLSCQRQRWGSPRSIRAGWVSAPELTIISSPHWGLAQWFRQKFSSWFS